MTEFKFRLKNPGQTPLPANLQAFFTQGARKSFSLGVIDTLGEQALLLAYKEYENALKLHHPDESKAVDVAISSLLEKANNLIIQNKDEPGYLNCLFDTSAKESNPTFLNFTAAVLKWLTYEKRLPKQLRTFNPNDFVDAIAAGTVPDFTRETIFTLFIGFGVNGHLSTFQIRNGATGFSVLDRHFDPLTRAMNNAKIAPGTLTNKDGTARFARIMIGGQDPDPNVTARWYSEWKEPFAMVISFKSKIASIAAAPAPQIASHLPATPINSTPQPSKPFVPKKYPGPLPKP